MFQAALQGLGQFASRLALPVFALGLAAMTVYFVEPPVDEAEERLYWTEERAADLDRMSGLLTTFGREWERLMVEVRAAATTGDPKDQAAIATFAAIEEEYYRRAKLDRGEAFRWIISRLQGKSLHELTLTDDLP